MGKSMEIETAEIAKIVHDGVTAHDTAVVELCARLPDAEAERLESAADNEPDAVLSRGLRSGARALRRVAIAIRALKEKS